MIRRDERILPVEARTTIRRAGALTSGAARPKRRFSAENWRDTVRETAIKARWSLCPGANAIEAHADNPEGGRQIMVRPLAMSVMETEHDDWTHRRAPFDSSQA